MFAEDRSRKYQLLYLRTLSENKKLKKQLAKTKERVDALEQEIKKSKTIVKETVVKTTKPKTKKKTRKPKIAPSVVAEEETNATRGLEDDNSNNAD